MSLKEYVLYVILSEKDLMNSKYKDMVTDVQRHSDR